MKVTIILHQDSEQWRTLRWAAERLLASREGLWYVGLVKVTPVARWRSPPLQTRDLSDTKLLNLFLFLLQDFLRSKLIRSSDVSMAFSPDWVRKQTWQEIALKLQSVGSSSACCKHEVLYNALICKWNKTGSVYSIMQQSALLATFVAIYLPHLYLDRNSYVCQNIKCICIWQSLDSNLRFGYSLSWHHDFLQYP
jgi:hypothetical protein